MSTTQLYRPVGCTELGLIELEDMTMFPPRLKWQPIFYPVLDEKYACQIASEWNTKDEFSGFAGFVLSFKINTEYFEKFEVQNVGERNHNEIWVPAEDLEEFNKQIVEPIKVIKAFYSRRFMGYKKYENI